ncbi:MAG TPA: hypothetical protein VLM75_11740 [Spirochaetota bacterium]|nr:hypothetical protein [Spirochaetota bacterium]
MSVILTCSMVSSFAVGGEINDRDVERVDYFPRGLNAVEVSFGYYVHEHQIGR